MSVHVLYLVAHLDCQFNLTCDQVSSFLTYNEMKRSTSFAVVDNIIAKVNVVNVLNGAGLTKGSPRTDEAGSYINGHVLARPILLRRVVASLYFNF